MPVLIEKSVVLVTRDTKFTTHIVKFTYGDAPSLTQDLVLVKHPAQISAQVGLVGRQVCYRDAPILTDHRSASIRSPTCRAIHACNALTGTLTLPPSRIDGIVPPAISS
jgi:hypothetical protein